MCHRAIVRCWAGLFAALFVSVVAVSAARAADPKDPAKENLPPDPETVNLETKDGLQLEATYYGSLKGKDAVPVILLHMHKGSRADMDGLARYLQAAGHAVIAPDLRGHGKSTQIKRGDDVKTIDAANLRLGDYDAMVTQDMQTVKKYLIERNNEAKLNIEKLCVAGAEMGAVVAMNWAVYDWDAPILPNYKQGQDVKAVALISPAMNFKGINATAALNKRSLQTDLSVLIIVGGKTPKALDDAQRIDKRMSAARPKPPADEKERREKQDLFFDNLPTTLEGTKILEEPQLATRAANDLAQFIDARLVTKKFPWAVRKNPLGD